MHKIVSNFGAIICLSARISKIKNSAEYLQKIIWIFNFPR